MLPNKRGALFLKKHLAQSFAQTMWLPRILSAEELVEELSGLKLPEEIDLICLLYESYRACYGARAENFEGFARWGSLILQDFNEIDKSLANPAQLYDNLKDVKVIENWSLGQEPLTEHQKAYLDFMGSLGNIYRHYTHTLLQRGQAYQGLAYRHAVTLLEQSSFANNYDNILVCGFNALNAAELKIFNRFVKLKKATLLWDADEYYLNDTTQEAGLFMRVNLQTFPQREPLFIEQNFKTPKHIRVVSVPRQMGQAQVVKQHLETLLQQNIPPDKIAVVLANEKLLWSVLQQLPAGLKSVNVTMEYPLRYSAAYSLIEQLLQLQLGLYRQTKTNKAIYHKDLTGLLRQPLFSAFLKASGCNLDPYSVIREITTRNLAFAGSKQLQQLFAADYAVVAPFLEQAASARDLNGLFVQLIETLIAYFESQDNNSYKNLEMEYLQVIYKNFNRLSELLDRYPYFADLQSYRQLFTQIVGNSTAPFIGEPLSGLQIMGVLETRNLDFEHVILVNANEGVIPSGKSSNSFIPNDLKRSFGLPLYNEKDAVYAYHFFRLLQRAKHILITYDSETDSFGKGEKSRFVTQLELELKTYNPAIQIENEVAGYTHTPPIALEAISIQKTAGVLKPITEKALHAGDWGGLSPSGLITYKDCSLKFYFRYSARLTETEEVEESADAGTFGSILHLSLEELYKNYTGQIVSSHTLKESLGQVDEVVHRCFISFFDNEKPGGKNLLQEEVIKVYVKKLVQSDIKRIERLEAAGQNLFLNWLEKEFSATLPVKSATGLLEVVIKGKIDRIDTIGEQLRIIDYKSAVKDTDKFVFGDLEALFYDKNYNKQLQLLLYAWLLYKNNIATPESLSPCIVPFKVFNEEPKYLLHPDKNRLLLNGQLMVEFETALSAFIAGILDTDTDFVQTTDEEVCKFCAYNVICGRNDK